MTNKVITIEFILSTVLAIMLGIALSIGLHGDFVAPFGNPTVIAGVGVTHLRYPVRKA